MILFGFAASGDIDYVNKNHTRSLLRLENGPLQAKVNKLLAQ